MPTYHDELSAMITEMEHQMEALSERPTMAAIIWQREQLRQRIALLRDVPKLVNLARRGLALTDYKCDCGAVATRYAVRTDLKALPDNVAQHLSRGYKLACDKCNPLAGLDGQYGIEDLSWASLVRELQQLADDFQGVRQ